MEKKGKLPPHTGGSCIPVNALKMHLELEECSPIFFFHQNLKIINQGNYSTALSELLCKAEIRASKVFCFFFFTSSQQIQRSRDAYFGQLHQPQDVLHEPLPHGKIAWVELKQLIKSLYLISPSPYYLHICMKSGSCLPKSSLASGAAPHAPFLCNIYHPRTPEQKQTVHYSCTMGKLKYSLLNKRPAVEARGKSKCPDFQHEGFVH